MADSFLIHKRKSVHMKKITRNIEYFFINFVHNTYFPYMFEWFCL